MDRRTYPDSPIVGVGAVVLRGGSVLLIKRGKPPLSESWSLPGGRVKEGENLKEAAAREVREECAVDIEVFDLIKTFEYIERDAESRVKFHYFVFDFRAEYRSGSLAALTDALDARWVEGGDLDRYALTDAAKEVIEEGFRIASSSRSP
jgi:ADP-ribose pyrophosphatase YjhB (NUDIX family)